MPSHASVRGPLRPSGAAQSMVGSVFGLGLGARPQQVSRLQKDHRCPEPFPLHRYVLRAGISAQQPKDVRRSGPLSIFLLLVVDPAVGLVQKISHPLILENAAHLFSSHLFIDKEAFLILFADQGFGFSTFD